MQTLGKIPWTCFSSSRTFSMKPLSNEILITSNYYNMKSLLTTGNRHNRYTPTSCNERYAGMRSKPWACVDLEQLLAWPASVEWRRITKNWTSESCKTMRKYEEVTIVCAMWQYAITFHHDAAFSNCSMWSSSFDNALKHRFSSKQTHYSSKWM